MGMRFKKAAAVVLSAALVVGILPFSGHLTARADENSGNTGYNSDKYGSYYYDQFENGAVPMPGIPGDSYYYTPAPSSSTGTYHYNPGTQYSVPSSRYSAYTVTASPSATAPATAPAVDKLAPKIGTLSIKSTTKKKKGYIVVPAIKLSWIESGMVESVKVYRAAGGSKLKLFKTIKSDSVTSFTDKSVKRGKKYSYKVGITGMTVTGAAVESQSEVVKKKVSSNMTKPAFTTKKKGKKLTITFKKIEGSFYETQYRYNKGRKKWAAIPSMKGKVSKKITRKILASGFKIRIRTYVKDGKKKVYSPWKSSGSI